MSGAGSENVKEVKFAADWKAIGAAVQKYIDHVNYTKSKQYTEDYDQPPKAFSKDAVEIARVATGMNVLIVEMLVDDLVKKLVDIVNTCVKSGKSVFNIYGYWTELPEASLIHGEEIFHLVLKAALSKATYDSLSAKIARFQMYYKSTGYEPADVKLDTVSSSHPAWFAAFIDGAIHYRPDFCSRPKYHERVKRLEILVPHNPCCSECRSKKCSQINTLIAAEKLIVDDHAVYR